MTSYTVKGGVSEKKREEGKARVYEGRGRVRISNVYI